MNPIKNITAAMLSALSVGYFGAAQAAETIKPLQGVSFHTATKDAVAYFASDEGTCKVVLTLTDKAAYAPARFEKTVEARKSILHLVDDGTALEFACQEHAQAMTINLISTVANEH
jgi:hypothetical protein